MKDWRKSLEESCRSVSELKKVLPFTPEEEAALEKIAERYPVCVTPYYLSLIDPADKNDPIRKMSIPDMMEFSEGGTEDTSGEFQNTVLQGVQHKYQQTILILSTNQCAMYCRHCFRKRMVGMSSDEIASGIPQMVEYIKAHPQVNNVLISGGDAFLNSNQVLRQYLEHFTPLEQLDFIRFGTRTPVVMPERVTDDPELIEMLREYGRKKQIVVVTHFNHPRELTPQSREAVRLMREAGCVVRNQTVLLRGINDKPEILGELMNGLMRVGAVPYYIFQCRPAAGVKNQFQVPLREGCRIVDEAKRMMNGQSKSVRYAMSHVTGKIEILGSLDGEKMLFKYHQAKYEKDNARMFAIPVADGQNWLDTKEIPQ